MYEKEVVEEKLIELERIIEETDDIEAKYMYSFYSQFTDDYNNELLKQCLQECIEAEYHDQICRYNLYMLLHDTKEDDRYMFRVLNEMFEHEGSLLEEMRGLLYNCIGDCYKEGRGVDQDYKKAYEAYNTGLQCSKYIDNLISIGDLYYEGLYPELDYTKALEYYTKALEDSYEYPNVITNKESSRSNALDRIGRCYMYGKGVKQNLSKAREYLEDSMDVFSVKCSDNRKDMEILKEMEKK